MDLPWYYYILYVFGGSLVLWFMDKFNIIKSKPLRYFTGIFVYCFICGVIYDLFLAPK